MTLSRRALGIAGAGLLFAPAIKAQTPAWNRAAYVAAMAASGRPTEISEGAFAAIQARRQPTLARIDAYLKSRFGEADPAVVRAFGEVPREYFHYNYEARQNGASNAYETEAKPWAIGFGSALSDYLG